MLTMTDEQGNRWDVAVGRASFGSLAFLFSRPGSDKVFHHPVTASSRLEAERALRDMGAGDLRSLLHKASPWTGKAEGLAR